MSGPADQVERALRRVEGLPAGSALEGVLFSAESNVASLVGQALSDTAVFDSVKGMVGATWHVANDRSGPLLRLWRTAIPRAMRALVRHSKEKEPKPATFVGRYSGRTRSNSPPPKCSLLASLARYEEVELDEEDPKSDLDWGEYSYVLRPVVSWADAGRQSLKVLREPLVTPEVLLCQHDGFGSYARPAEVVPYVTYPLLGDFSAAAAVNRLAYMVNTVAELAARLDTDIPGGLLGDFRKASEAVWDTGDASDRRSAWTLVQIHLAGRSGLGRKDVLPIVPDSYEKLRAGLKRRILEAARGNGAEGPHYARSNLALRQEISRAARRKAKADELNLFVREALAWLLSEFEAIEEVRSRTEKQGGMEKRKELIRRRNTDILKWWKETGNLEVVASRLAKTYESLLRPRFWKIKQDSLKRIIRKMTASSRS